MDSTRPQAGRARWRPWLVALHRDVGFVCLGLTLVYAISGFAVNHRHDWDYNRSRRVTSARVGTAAELLAAELAPARRAELTADPGRLTKEEEARLIERLTAALGRPRPPRNAFWRGPDRLSLFYETGDRDTVDYSPRAGEARRTVVRDRFLLRDLNFLHLNERHGPWTYVADGYAVLLAFLGLSGAIMVKGRRGLRGRGGILVALGVAVPIVALILMR